MTVNEKIKLIRQEKGLTQKELGYRLGGISQQQIGQWETGKANPKYETLQKIANALEVDLIELIGVKGIVEQSRNILNNFNNNPEKWVQMDIETGKEIPLRGSKLQSKQIVLLNHYNQLNEAGKDKAIERVEELTEIPRYTDKE